MTNLAWIPLYFGDHLRDTVGMTETERVTYFAILLRYQQINPMPSDPILLAERLSLRTETVREANPARWPFLRTTDEGLVWPDLDALLMKQHALRETNSQRAKKAVQARERRRLTASEHAASTSDNSPPCRPSSRIRARSRSKEDHLRDDLRDEIRVNASWGEQAFSDLK